MSLGNVHQAIALEEACTKTIQSSYGNGFLKDLGKYLLVDKI